MAKRFIDTELFKDPFVRKLSGEMKLLWIYLFTHCDNAGLWSVELDVAELRLGFNYDRNIVLKTFGERLVELDAGDTWFLPAFIKFQYSLPLSDDNRALKGVISKLAEKNLVTVDQNNNGLFDLSEPPLEKNQNLVKEDIKVSEPPLEKNQKSLKGLRIKNKDKDKDKEEEKEKEKEEKGKEEAIEVAELMSWPSFEDFWDAYDKKVGNKLKLRRKWEVLSRRDKEEIMSHLPRYKLAVPDKQFRKNPETYLNNKSWNDEIIESTNSKRTNNRLTSEQRMAMANDTSY